MTTNSQPVLALKASYDEVKEEAVAFLKALESDFFTITRNASVFPVLPIEGRVKDWISVVRKIDYEPSKLKEIKDIRELWDLVGLRLVFLSSGDVARGIDLIRKEFEAGPIIDKGDELAPKEFGYLAKHLQIHLRPTSLGQSSFTRWNKFQAEIQVRTLSQHAWAVGSRLLQYRQKIDAPRPLQRSLYRLAALLEITDSEFERISQEKAEYMQYVNDNLEKELAKPLNIDSLIIVLNRELPEMYKDDDEPYGKLLDDLNKCKIVEVRDLTGLIREHLNKALEHDHAVIQAIKNGDLRYEGKPEKIAVGIFYNHVGLVENMLDQKFPSDWRNK